MDNFQFASDLDPRDFQKGGGDDKLFVVFYMGVIQDQEASVAQGRPIYVDTECVRIYTPGDRSNTPDRPVRDSDKVRWPKQYAAFKAGGDADSQLQGTPLTEWPGIGRAMCEELKYLGIRTVDQLAEVRDDVCARVPGLMGLKQTAGVWLGKSKSTAEAAKTLKRMDDLDAENASLREAVKDLMARSELLSAQLDTVTKRGGVVSA